MQPKCSKRHSGFGKNQNTQYGILRKMGKGEKYIWPHLFNIFINNVSLYINISYADESTPSTSGRFIHAIGRR